MTILRLASRVDFIATLDALLCIARGLRLRGWNRLCITAMLNPHYYDGWTLITEPKLFANFVPTPVSHHTLPVIGVILGEEDDILAGKITARSMRAALCADSPLWTTSNVLPECKILTAEQSGSLFDTLTFLRAKYGPCLILPMRAGDTVSSDLGGVLSQISVNNPNNAIAYWDEDIVTDGVRHSPWIKPSWDELLYLARDCLSGSCVIQCDAAISVAETMGDASVDTTSFARLFLMTAGSTTYSQPYHVPLILSHKSTAEGFVSRSVWQDLIADYWHPPMQTANSAASSPYIKFLPVQSEPWPSVSIVIPTRDHADLLRTCLTSLQMLTYPGPTEIVIVDNGSEAQDALELLQDVERSGVAQVIRCPGPFNFSGLNNRAVDRIRSEFICLLNNDIEALDGEWLGNMIIYAMRPDTGAVGAQLLYPDHTVQHAGVVIGMGNAAGHVQKGIEPSASDHFSWHGVTRTVSAVTAACMVVRRDYYLSVGKLDEHAFAVAYNDVDLCLKLKAKGLRNIYVADARLIHHESKSRGDDYSPEHFQRYQRELAGLQSKWRTEGYVDPHFSPIFSRASERCVLQF